jgi:hypothetical protein
MRYEFFDKNGIEQVRISIGGDVVERAATEADHAAADEANAAEDAALAANEQATKERVERENENERRTQEGYASERTRLDADVAADRAGKPTPAAAESQQKIEREFDQKLEQELETREQHPNGKKTKTKPPVDAE